MTDLLLLIIFNLIIFYLSVCLSLVMLFILAVLTLKDLLTLFPKSLNGTIRLFTSLKKTTKTNQTNKQTKPFLSIK